MELRADIASVSENMSEDYKIFYLRTQLVSAFVFYPIICAFGIIGNVLSIIVMSQNQMRSSSNIYLIALALADLIKLIWDFLYFVAILLIKIDTYKGNKFYSILYPYAHYCVNASLCVSAWLIVSVAIERYIYVCYPARVKFYCNINKAKGISLSVFTILPILSIPYALRYTSVQTLNNKTGIVEYEVEKTRLWHSKAFSETYSWLQNLLRSYIPLVILIILNACILYELRRCRFMRTKTTRKHRITSMLLTVVVLFLICITPDTVMSTFGFGYSEENYLARGIREITDLLLLINSGANVVIYSIFNTIFWSHFQRLICCKRFGTANARNISMLNYQNRRSNRHRSNRL